jgi:LPS-assembly lipoprotein
MKVIIPVLLAMSLALLNACGFALRGTTPLPPELQTLQMASMDPNSELEREVLRSLRGSGVDVVASGDVYVLGLGVEQGSERTLSVNSNARAGEYELEMRVQFQLSQAGTTVYGPDSVAVTRFYLTDPENAVAKAEEADLIRSEMRRELAQQILRRLQNAVP